MALTCFKAYDIRGRIGFDLNEDLARSIGHAFAQRLNAKRIVVGGDVRLSTPALKAAAMEGILRTGADVIDLGQTGTEEVYFASLFLDVDGGIEITASHNPADYNGMKFVGAGGRPIGIDDEFADIRSLVAAGVLHDAPVRGTVHQRCLRQEYVDYILRNVNWKHFKPLKIVTDAGNGAAGAVVDVLEQRFASHHIPVEFIKINHAPNGTFPHGVPNPLLPENRSLTSAAVREHKADLGIAWDGDFDRCFLFDEQGEFIAGYYIAGLLTEIFLQKHPHANFVIDARLDWNTKDIIAAGGGHCTTSRTGHSFFKEMMRRSNAVYGGEISAHHYFKEFGFCDSGMLPWLLIVGHLSGASQPISKLVAARKHKFPCSEEINFRVPDVAAAMASVEACYAPQASVVEKIDGITFEMPQWRFNLRGSNTEPYLRLNIETRGSERLLAEKITELSLFIKKLANR